MKVNYMNIIYDEYNNIVEARDKLEKAVANLSNALDVIIDNPNIIDDDFEDLNDDEKDEKLEDLKSIINDFRSNASDASYYIDEALANLSDNNIV